MSFLFGKTSNDVVGWSTAGGYCNLTMTAIKVTTDSNMFAKRNSLIQALSVLN